MNPPRSRRVPALAAALATALTCLTVSAATPAAAQGRVSVVNDRGTAQADLRYRTTMTVTGSGFQSVRGGFGGVYVMFGWVDDPGGGSWRPSRGGLTGQDYRYVPDSESAGDNRGYLRFIAFPDSSTAEEANAVLGADGSFAVDLVVPGPTFESVDRSGAVRQVDCRRVTCGVITLGAHGVASAPNETFTPVSFGTVYDAAPQAAASDSDGPRGRAGSGRPSATEPTGGSDAAAGQSDGRKGEGSENTGQRLGKPRLEVDRSTATAGRALAFSGGGMQPGEQVLVVLDDGLAALGPLRAGDSGEVAGVIQLPEGTAVGTHELHLHGAASGRSAIDRFPVAAAPETAPTAVVTAPVAEASTASLGSDRAGPFALAASALVFAVALGVAAVRRRRTRTATPPTRGATP